MLKAKALVTKVSPENMDSKGKGSLKLHIIENHCGQWTLPGGENLFHYPFSKVPR